LKHPHDTHSLFNRNTQKNLPSYGLKKGNVATIVEHIENATEDGYILEFFDAEGNTVSVVPVLASDIATPYPHAIVNYRRIKKTA
jgi:Domain of unknown function (DUF4926)